MKFRTSGLRGLVIDFVGRTSALYAEAFAKRLIAINAANPNSIVVVGRDFRSSSYEFPPPASAR